MSSERPSKILVRVGKAAFIKERETLYADFESAMARELAQNSLDAGARNIIARTCANEDGTITLTYEDDGQGMSREVLENVWFELGATTKQDTEETGGYGRARLLLCFSMENYEIRTRDCLVRGNGPEADPIESGLPHFNGCRFTIVIPAGTSSKRALDRAFARHHRLSRYQAHFTLNGELLERNPIHAGRLIRELRLEGEERAWAQVFANRSAGTNSLLVWVNGVMMYEAHSEAPAQVIIQIDPRNSRRILTASRDRLRNKYEAQLSCLVRELAIEGANAVKPRFRSRNELFRIGGILISNPKQDRPAAEGRAGEGARHMAGSSNTFIAAGKGRATLQQDRSGPDSTSSSFPSRQEQVSASVPRHAQMPDVAIIDECEDPRIRKVIASWSASSWDLDNILRNNRGRGRNRLRLLRAWQIACSSAIEALHKAHPEVGSIAWTVGWYFPADGELACHQHRAFGHILALRPVDESGRCAYRFDRREDLNRLVAIARHEVAHIVYKWHDAGFANLMTTLDAEMHDASIISRMRAV